MAEIGHGSEEFRPPNFAAAYLSGQWHGGVSAGRQRWRVLKPGNALMRPAEDCRLEEIPAWIAIVAACRDCNRVEHANRKKLTRRFGEKVVLVEIEHKLRCTRCGQQGSNKFFLVAIPRG